MNNIHKFEMSVGLPVLQSLGINLYSNAAAVLTEVVANAWDAEATTVEMTWNRDSNTLTILDNGTGMSEEHVNSRFLNVGYQKRLPGNEGTHSPRLHRPYMGRKGIGKLSVFSVASNIKVESKRIDCPATALSLSLDKLEEAIRDKAAYHPTEELIDGDFPPHGTRLTLSNLQSKRFSVTIAALRKRLARRFDILDFEPDDPNRFDVYINGRKLSYEDRDDLARIEYIWTIGDTEIDESATPKLKKSWHLPGVVDSAKGWSASGWFGATGLPSDLVESDSPISESEPEETHSREGGAEDEGSDGSESLRNIMVLARRRPIHEGILDQIRFNKLFTSYLTGQVTADFLDVDDEYLPDIATSDRQRLIEDDIRVVALRKFLRMRITQAETNWANERPKSRFDSLSEQYPAVREWVDSRPSSHRKVARRLLQTIASADLVSEAERRELLKSGILGFERIALDENLHALEAFAGQITADTLLPALSARDQYESALYAQIIRSRLAAIEQLQQLIDGNEIEAALQGLLHENLWILDPRWEHPEATPVSEATLRRLRSDLFGDEDAIAGQYNRIDITYRSFAGTQIILELKRYQRRVTLDDLYEQGARYHKGLLDVVGRANPAASGAPIEVVFIVGPNLVVGDTGTLSKSEFIDSRLHPINGRILSYDNLLEDAERSYRDFIEIGSISDRALSAALSSLDESISEA